MSEMNLRNLSGIIITGFFVFLPVNGQNKDKAIFRVTESGFFQNSIMKNDREYREQMSPVKIDRAFAVDFTGYQLPNKKDLYKNQQWHNPPVSQGNTNTCWCFSTTSFLESEVYRINKMKVRLSEMYTVYWEFVEKVRQYVQKRGNSSFAEGSEANAVTRVWKKYGIIPESDYTGLPEGRKFHNHEDMFKEMRNYLESLKVNSAWDEETAVATIKSIMNHYMGEPPAEILINGKKVTPLAYLHDVIRIDPDDYVDILSYEQEPFYQHVEYKVPDNWWHSADYCNVPLDIFMETLKKVVRNG